MAAAQLGAGSGLGCPLTRRQLSILEWLTGRPRMRLSTEGRGERAVLPGLAPGTRLRWKKSGQCQGTGATQTKPTGALFKTMMALSRDCNRPARAG